MTTPRGESVTYRTQTIGLNDVLLFLRRGALLAVFLGIVAGGTAFLYTRNVPPIYQGTVALLASQSNSAYARLGLIAPPPVDPAVYQTAVLEGTVARDALAKILGHAPSAQQLQRFLDTIHIAVQNQNISSVIRISVDSTDPKFAAAAANGVADGLIDWDIDRARQTVSRSIDALQQSIQDIDNQLRSGGANGKPLSAQRKEALTALLQQRRQELSTARARSESSVMVGLLEPLSTAAVPTEPIGPKVAFRTLVAVILGLALAYGLLFIRWALDPRARGRGEMSSLTGLRILAEFPLKARGSRGLSVEAANLLRSNLMVAAEREMPLALAVTTPRKTEDKESVSMSLAASLARAGYRALVVDADLRHPSTAYGLDVSQVSTPPLEVYLENPGMEFTPVSVTIGGKHSFDFLPSFTAASYPVELLNRGLWPWLEVWRSNYDFVIVDCPPVLPFADTLTVAPMCSGVLLCADPGSVTRAELKDSTELLRRHQVRLLGIALTRVRLSRRGRRSAPARQPAPRAGEPPNPYKTLNQGATNVQVKER